MTTRREFLRQTGVTILGGFAAPSSILAAASGRVTKPDYKLSIQPCKIEIAPGVVIETRAYNGQVPGPILRLREGVPVNIDVTNAGAEPDIVHWHGLAIDSLNDGAMEEGSPMIAPGSQLRYTFTPRPSGTRWYHTHAGSGGNLALGTYSGQFGFLIVEGKSGPTTVGNYDQEVFLAIHHWEPSFVPMAETMRDVLSESAAHFGFRCRI